MADREVAAEGNVDSEGHPLDEHARWVHEIQLYEKEADKWISRSKKIIKRYKDDRSDAEKDRGRYNILWSNVQTLQPALYSRNPIPDIERRHKQKDDLGRVTADVLERTTTYFVNTEDFKQVMIDAVLDRLLPGRGVVWVRYMPHFRDVETGSNEEVAGEGAQITDDVYSEMDPSAEPVQEIYYEEVCFDYVHWQDYGHTIARTTSEVRAIWRKVYMTRQEGVERFGEAFNDVPLDYVPMGLSDEKISDDMKKATVYEIWDKPSKKALWLHKNHPELLDKKDDPLGVKGFFPAPIPLLATTANDSLIPVPDYIEYQDQASELDSLTGRITAITKAIKVAGVCDASAEGVERLLSEGTENQLIPVEQWAVFGEKGGLKGAMELMPMQEIAATLLMLYEAREKVKQDLYEITGIADIVRGQSDPNETLGAQQLKGQYATMRLSSQQDDVKRFARDLVQIAAQIIAKHFQLDTIKKISGVTLLTQQEKAQIQQQQAMQAQQAQMQVQPGQQPQPPAPLPEDMQELMIDPTWEEVYALLQDDAMLGFRIDIETDSTIKPDQDAEKQSRIELLTAAASFMGQMSQIEDPTMKVLAAKLFEFGIRGFSAGKQVESAIEIAVSKIEKAAANPAPQPSPEEIKAKTEIQKQQMQNQSKQQEVQVKAQTELQKAQIDAQTELQANAMENQREEMRIHNEAMQGAMAAGAQSSENTQIVAMLREMNNTIQSLSQRFGGL